MDTVVFGFFLYQGQDLRTVKPILFKVETILKEREVAFLSPSNMPSTFEISGAQFLGDKNATSPFFNIVSTLTFSDINF